MFPAVCHKFVKATGPDTMVPVESLEKAQNTKPLNIIVKKVIRRFLFWKKIKYIPYDFQLQDLLQDSNDPLEAKTESKPFCEFNPVSKYDLSGKFGVAIMNELMDGSLSASDTVTISSKLGEVKQTEVELQSLLEVLKQRKLNFEHEFIQQIRQNAKKVLCVVQAIYAIDKDAEIKRTDDLDGKLNAKAKIVSSVSVNADAKVTMENQRNLVLPAGTPIAYSLCELQVCEDDGTIVPMLVSGCKGGFVPRTEMIGESTMDAVGVQVKGDFFAENKEQLKKMRENLEPLFNQPSSEREEMRLYLMETLKCPSTVRYMADLLELVIDGEKDRLSVSELQENVKIDLDTCVKLLLRIGFTQDSDVLLCPREVNLLQEAVASFFDALEEQDEMTLSAIRQCSRVEGKTLIHVCENILVGQKLISLEDYRADLPQGQSGLRQISKLLNIELDLANDTAIAPDHLSESIQIQANLFEDNAQEKIQNLLHETGDL